MIYDQASVNWIRAFFFFLTWLKRWLVALAPTQSQKSGQRVLRSCNPVVHSRNEPGWGNKAGWGRGQGRPSCPKGMDPLQTLDRMIMPNAQENRGRMAPLNCA